MKKTKAKARQIWCLVGLNGRPLHFEHYQDAAKYSQCKACNPTAEIVKYIPAPVHVTRAQLAATKKSRTLDEFAPKPKSWGEFADDLRGMKIVKRKKKPLAAGRKGKRK